MTLILNANAEDTRDREISVSTRQASEMLSVHESSIKRWCNAGELSYWLTPGGHRRIPIQALVSFAEDQNIAFALRHFGDQADDVWAKYTELARTDNFGELASMLYRWIQNGEIMRSIHLIEYLRTKGFSLGDLFDRLLGQVMRKVGLNYFEGELSIADEHRMTQAMRDLLVTLSTTGIFTPEAAGSTRPVAIVGCARSEVHEVGALMVRVLLESMGWKVIYLGLNVPTEEFAHQQIKYQASLVCISMFPPMGMPEATAMINLMDRMYDQSKPYRLVLGGSALDTTIDKDKFDVQLSDVQLFSRVNPFYNWVQSVNKE
jgi:excisionase family DNA binding protein